MRIARLCWIVVAIAALTTAATAADKAWDDCNHSTDDDRKIAECTRVVARATKESKKNRAIAHIERGRAYRSKDDYDGAIRDYDEAIRLDPTSADAYRIRGSVYYQKNDYDRAIRDYNEAIRLDPKFSPYYYFRGEAYAEKGDYDRAMADYKEAFRIDPNPKDVSYFEHIAKLYLKNDDYDHAIADFDQFIRLNPKNIGAIIFRGQLFYMKGDYDRAVAYLNEAVHTAPEAGLFGLYANRFHVYARKNEFDSAFADIERLSRLGSKYEDARALNSILCAFRAYVFGRKGQIDRAFAEIGEAFKHGTNEADVDSLALFYRGELHLMKGDARAALSDFDASLANRGRVPLVFDIYARAGRDAALRALAAPQPPVAPSATVTQPVAPPASSLAETRVALVIGNAGYAAQSPLKNPSNDARAIAGALRGAGFRKVEVAENLSRDALVKSLQAFQEEADRADWAVIYFSGHGVEIGGVNYVVPTDARLLTDRNAPDEAVSLDRLMASVGGAHKLRIVILDACRDNPFVASMRRTIASRSAGKGLSPVEPTRATLVVYAARDGQLAQDGVGDNSRFAAALARRLGEPHVEVSKLFRLVTDDVLDATGHRQQPFVYGSLPGREDFYFRP